VGAHLGDVLVGAIVGTRPGHCHLCQVLAREPRPDDPLEAIDWQFHQNIFEVHRSLDDHAWIDKVGTEKALHGNGIGRRLVDAAADALKHDAPADLVLECAPDRTTFYIGLQFEPVTTFADPAGPDAVLMRRRIG
jgi:GNAT superfamily N-acetyltransferase